MFQQPSLHSITRQSVIIYIREIGNFLIKSREKILGTIDASPEVYLKFSLEELCEYLTKDYGDNSHDLKHHQDVCRTALEIFDKSEFKEYTAESIARIRSLIKITAMLHDTIDHKFTKQLEIRKSILERYCESKFSEEKENIYWVIEHVSYSKEAKRGFIKHTDPVVDISLRCVSAADKFYALGLIGIERCIQFTVAKLLDQMETITYDTVMNLVIDHCNEKLLLLMHNYMHVEYAKAMSYDAHTLIQIFIKEHTTKLPMDLSLIHHLPDKKIADDAPTIFISDYDTAKCILHFAEKMPIDVVINVSNYDHEESTQNSWKETHIRYEYHPILDNEDQELIPTALKVFGIIENCRYQNVLIHCYAGISRSVSMVIFYYMKKYLVHYETALDHVWIYRQVADPNEGFRQQLKDW